MSLHDFKAAVTLHRADTSFHALVMAAMLRADTDNAQRLRYAFPAVYDETQARWRGAGGRIPGDPDYEQVQRDREAIGMPPT